MYEVTKGGKGGKLEQSHFTRKGMEKRNYQGDTEKSPGSNVKGDPGHAGHQAVINQQATKRHAAPLQGAGESAGHTNRAGSGGTMHLGAPKKHMDRNNAGGGRR
jgi:hypothetical protein